MATVQELYAGTRESSGDVRYNRGVRRFAVYDAVRQDVMLTPGLPVIGSSFYFHGKQLNAVAYAVEGTDSPTVHFVTFDYDDVEFEKAESCSMEPTEEEYPLYLPEKYLADITSPTSEPQYRQKWVLKVLKFENYRMQLVVTLMYPQVWGSNERAQTLKQIGKIHSFQGYDWQFKGANADREGPNRFRVSYRWTSDPGFDGRDLLSFLEPLNTPYIIPKRPGDLSISRYIRNPFETYLTVPAKELDDGDPTTFESDTPTIALIDSKNRSPNGHLTLPGNPIA